MFPKFYYEFLGTSAALGTLPRVKASNVFRVMQVSTCIRVSFLWWLHICFFSTFSPHVALREDVPTRGRFLDGKSINQSINQSVNQSFYQSIIQSIHQTINQSDNQTKCSRHYLDTFYTYFRHVLDMF